MVMADNTAAVKEYTYDAGNRLVSKTLFGLIPYRELDDVLGLTAIAESQVRRNDRVGNYQKRNRNRLRCQDHLL